MYEILLYLHSWGRWLVLIGAVWAIVKNYTGWQQRRTYLKADNTAAVFFIAMLHLQVVIGLLLYFVWSPYAQQALADMGAAMKDRELRFWGVEHLTSMLLAAVVAQVGRIRSKRASSDLLKHRRAFWFFVVALAIILLSIPWGGHNPYRPLFRF
ncbi:MAG: hypothetical protein WBA12_04690 [Catalinimonas sp.]